MQREGRRILPTKARVLGAHAVFSCPMYQGSGETEFLVRARLWPANGKKSRTEIELHLELHRGDGSDGERLADMDVVVQQMRDVVGRNVHLLGHPSSLIINQTIGRRQEQDHECPLGRVRPRLQLWLIVSLVESVAFVIEAIGEETTCLHYELLRGEQWPEVVAIGERRVEHAKILERARLKFRQAPCYPGAFTYRTQPHLE